MAQHGKSLAALHELVSSRAPDRLLPRLASNEKVLVEVCALLARSAETQRRVTPAGEWLLDNFYLIEEEIRTAKRHLPPGYSRELPRLSRGPSAGLPRVYDLALQTVAHGDARVGRGTLSRFVASYQSVKPLQLGELWAIPIMLRLALIENLRRVAVRIAAGRVERILANAWADNMLDVAEKDPKGLILVIADMARSDPPMTSPFVAELARRLQGRSAALALPLTWIEQHLAESNLTIEQLVHTEAQNQATAQVSVSNSIGSLRMLGAMDWREFVETLSLVEQALRRDPADVYARMDFTTRDEYRHAVERLARVSALTEAGVAQAAVELAADAMAKGATEPSRKAHVGHYLVGAGQADLEQVAQVRHGRWKRVRRSAGRQLVRVYSRSILALTLLLSAGAVWWASDGLAWTFAALPPGWWLLPAGGVLLLAASQLAVAMTNWAAGLLATPSMLPRMDYSFGIPPASRTLVVVPTLLGSERDIDDLVEQLEVRFLANRDAQLYFGLLTDFHDAAHERCPDDDALLRLARERIEALNRKHSEPVSGAHDGDRFFLFHRPRRWNPREGVWMGHERKRGKLADLNALLRGRAGAGPGERFSAIVGDTVPLRAVRYVITLDTDTQLPRDTAWQFVATMAHPLNRPRFGGPAESQRVVGGYGILQPRVGVSLPSANRSRYARLVGGDPGIDPYTRAVSDVYQDLFGEGSFIGKGIYDVDAFEHVLGGRLLENSVLSHDLLEGCYARSGLISDVQLVEESPSRYDADVKRRHRWIRGDWQIVGWLLPSLRGPAAAGAGRSGVVKVRNPLSALSRWKIADNLRRSLTPAALTLLFLLGWSVLQPPWVWTLVGLAIVFVPSLLALSSGLLRKPDELRLGQHLSALVPSTARQLGQGTLSLACLPYEAAFSLDAMVRTVWRLWISRRRLLEWQASSEVARRGAGAGMSDLLGTLARMWIGPALALVAFVGLAAYRPLALAFAAPVLGLWLLSPLIVWWVSQPLQRPLPTLNAEQVDFLRLLSRRTWAFFEHFVGPQDNFLPPDNMQEHPVERVAHRTSPTNIGLSLLSALAAYDFGYITLGQLIERTRATLDTMDRLQRHRGHFFNWYDTQTLQPLRPCYVSTIDSGNLAGHLLTLRAGLGALADAQPQPARLLDGLRDTAHLLQAATGPARSGDPPSRFALVLNRAMQQAEQTPVALCAAFEALARAAQEVVEWVATSSRSAVTEGTSDDNTVTPQAEAQRWAQALLAQCEAAVTELRCLAPGTGPRGEPLQRQADALPERSATLQRLAERAGAMAQMDYGFLYDPARGLLSIGYNVDEHRPDAGHYDLLASESRLASFFAIAKGDVNGEIAVLDGGARSADATAVARTRAMSLSKPALDELMAHNPPLAKSALAFVCARLRETTNQLEAIALHPLEVRVARFLMQALRLKGLDIDQPEVVLTLGMSQGELALLVGASRPRVNDALGALEMAGAIKRDGAKLRCRPDALAALAGQDEE